MTLQFKLRWDEQRRAWIARYKEGNNWCLKRVPCDITDEVQAEGWFTGWHKVRDLVPPPAPAPAPKVTVEQLCERWVKWIKDRPLQRGQKHSDAERLLRLWIRPFALAKVRCDELTLGDCVQWIEDVQAKGRADFTVRDVVGRVRTMFSDARGKGWNDRENFFNDGYVKQRLRGAKARRSEEATPLSLAEAQRVCAWSGEVIPLRRHTKNLVALCTGLRAAELAGLQIGDVHLDHDHPHLKVERQLESAPKHGPAKFKSPKRGSKRVVPLHPVAVEALRRYLATRGKLQPGDPVFPAPDGRFIYDPNASFTFRSDLVLYGVPAMFEGKVPFRFHDLRSTFLTLLTNAEVPDADVKALAGHAAPGVTRKHYVLKHLPRLYKLVAQLDLVPSPLKATA